MKFRKLSDLQRGDLIFDLNDDFVAYLVLAVDQHSVTTFNLESRSIDSWDQGQFFGHKGHYPIESEWLVRNVCW